jgi:hypothetical protein
MPQALAAACALKQARWRAEALQALADHLPGSLLAEAVKAARDIDNERWRSVALRALASRLVQSPRVELYALWKEALPALASRRRQDLLGDLQALLPIMVQLGGPEASADIFRAIQDVGRWWP